MVADVGGGMMFVIEDGIDQSGFKEIEFELVFGS